MLKTTKLMDALWSSRNRVWGVWAHSAFVLCEKKYGWNWQIGGTTCAINYYLSNVSSILCGVWGICITFELPEVQLIHELVHPDDDCNSCSFFGNLFVAKHANLSEMKGEISGPPSFWMVKIPPTCPSAIPGNSTWRCFTQPMAKKIHQVLSLSASQCVERRAGAIELSYRSFLVSWDDLIWARESILGHGWNLDKSETFYRVRICDIFRTRKMNNCWSLQRKQVEMSIWIPAFGLCTQCMWLGKTSPRRKHSVKFWSRSQPGPRAYPFLIHLVAISHQYCGELTALSMG